MYLSRFTAFVATPCTAFESQLTNGVDRPEDAICLPG